MVRLVFRPYTQFRRSICTSESLRTSIRVSPDFVLTRHSSPSFGSQRVRSWCASSRNENETPRECGVATLRANHPSSLGPREADLYFHCAFRFSYVPMTRAHARLLGPCFKTGPESTQSYSAADRRFTESVREHRSQQSLESGIGTVSDRRSVERACNGSDANLIAAPRHLYTVERVGREHRGSHRQECRRGSATGLRPTPNGSRRPTRGKVHAFETDREADGCERTEAHPSRTTPRVDRRNANEFPLSTFRVSQVYP